MNKETYESLKEVVKYLHTELNKIKKVDKKYHILVRLAQVETWIDEVSKDYEEEVK